MNSAILRFVQLCLVANIGLAQSAPKAPPKVISLGEIRIQGDVDRPTINFLIPRAKFDFLDMSDFLVKENLVQKISEAVNEDVFVVK
ncbi:MAG: hypothetical protein V4534_01615 [Myxococcota bacterium]